jgi:hypothetical protein
MSECCVEEAIITGLRQLPGTIEPENFFPNIRKCTDCLPYLVVKVQKSVDFQTSDAKRWLSNVTVFAVFKTEAEAMEYRETIENWLTEPGCLDLGACGCFCNTQISGSGISVPNKTSYSYSCVFRGHYKPNSVSSVSVL